jgi:hypothetical protein
MQGQLCSDNATAITKLMKMSYDQAHPVVALLSHVYLLMLQHASITSLSDATRVPIITLSNFINEAKHLSGLLAATDCAHLL